MSAKISMSVNKLRLSNYSMDKFIAPNMSELSECNLSNMSAYSSQQEHWLSNFFLNSMLRYKLPNDLRQFIIFFLRRSESAFREYENARTSLSDFINGDRQRISVYFRSLFHFETCIAQMWQAFDQCISFKKSQTDRNTKLFEKGDNSSLERLNILYNDSRHAINKIPQDGTVPLWITNDGIAGKNASISYKELAKILSGIGDDADYFSSCKVINMTKICIHNLL